MCDRFAADRSLFQETGVKRSLGTGCTRGDNVFMCTLVCCTGLHCTALHCSALHCTTLHCTELQTQYTLYYETQLHVYRGWNVFQCSALQHIIAHCSIIQCTAVQYSASQCTVIKRTCYSDALAVWLVLQAPFTRLKLSLTDCKNIT